MQFSENSRVWVYQSDKELTAAQVIELQAALDNFTTGWTAHDNQLKAKGEIRYNRFIVLVVDESQAGASGCSIDKSVHFMKQVEQHFGINLFDRFNLAYRNGEDVLSVPRHTFEELLTSKTITAEVPFKDSWHARLFGNLVG